MDDGFQLFDVLLFAAIAVFLLFRLRSVLGRRTGSEQQRGVPLPPRPVLPPAEQPSAAPSTPRLATVEGSPVPWSLPVPRNVTGVAALRAADPSFDPDAFIQGARAAFQIIVNSFAAGDAAALRPLLSDDVYRPFSEAIAHRTAAKETLSTNLLSIKSAEIDSSVIEGTTALVTVKFVSEQINVLRDADGKAIEGDPEHVEDKTDIWTFARPLRARDPNWHLVATGAP